MTLRCNRASLVRAAALAVLPLCAAACGYSEAAMRAQRDSANAMRAQSEARQHTIDELRQRNEALTASVRELGGNVETLEGSRGELQRSLEESRRALASARAREEQVRARAAQFRSLLEQFRTMIAAGNLSVRIVRNRMVLVLPEGVLFDTGHAEVKPQGRTILTEINTVLRGLPREFQIAGHTDNVPISTRQFPSNWELSAARGTSVARFMIANGMPENRISAAGYADTQPAGSNDTPEGRAQNRRIEIALQPDLSELPDLSALQSGPPAAPAAPTAPPAAR